MNADVGFTGLAIAPLSMPFARVSSATFNDGGFLISFVELQEKRKSVSESVSEREKLFLGVVKTEQSLCHPFDRLRTKIAYHNQPSIKRVTAILRSMFILLII